MVPREDSGVLHPSFSSACCGALDKAVLTGICVNYVDIQVGVMNFQFSFHIFVSFIHFCLKN